MFWNNPSYITDRYSFAARRRKEEKRMDVFVPLSPEGNDLDRIFLASVPTPLYRDAEHEKPAVAKFLLVLCSYLKRYTHDASC